MLSPDPANPGTLFLGGAQGGVWKTTNNGQFWTPLSDDQPSLAIGAIAVGSGGTVYAGTGEPNNCTDCLGGAGILQSSDGGGHWTQLGASTFGGSSFTKIIISPNNPRNLLASTTSGIFTSGDGGLSWAPTLGGYVSDMVMSPSDPATIYAADNGLIYKSVNGGASWTLLSAWTDTCCRIALAMSPVAPSTIFAATGNASGKLWESLDGGVSWSQLAAAAGFCDGQCYYDIFVAVDPTNVNIIYTGGIDLNRSADGGLTWTDIGPGCCSFSADIHPDKHAFAFSPSDHSTIYVGTDGGVWTTTVGRICSGGVLPDLCWINLNGGLGLAQFYALGASPTDPAVYIGGTQDNGVLFHSCVGVAVCDPLSSTWSQAMYGDGEWAGFDPINPSIVYLAITGSPGAPVDVYRSDSAGAPGSWVFKANLAAPDVQQSFAIDPTNPAIVYSVNTAYTQLVKSVNRGDDGWSTVLFTAPAGQGISAIAVAPSNGQHVYLGTMGGKFFRSTNGGATFIEEDIGLPAGRFLSAIVIDHLDPNSVVASFTGASTGNHVFSSTTGGNSWTDISSNLPNRSTNTLALLGGRIFVGMDQGVYMSPLPFKSQTVWIKAGSGLPNTQVIAIAPTADGSLVAATHGRGVWVLSPQGLSRVASLQSHSGENVFASAVIDPSNGFAYFGTYTTPGIIVKVRLSDFKIVGELHLTPNARQDGLSSAVIDPANHYAYFGTNTNPGALLRIDLSNFTPSGVTQWGGFGAGVSGANGFRSAVIDTSGTTHFAYFGTGNSPGAILQVDLSSFSPATTHSIVLSSGENALASAVIDSASHFAYFGTETSPGMIGKINLVTFTEVSPALVLGSGENFDSSAVIDTLNGFAYFGECSCFTGLAKVVKISLSTFTETASLTLPFNTALDAAVIDQSSGHAYFATFTDPGKIIQVNLASFTAGQTLTLMRGETGPQSAVIDTENGLAYFGSNDGPAVIVRVSLGFQPPTNWVSATTSSSGEILFSAFSSLDQEGWSSWADLLRSSPSLPALCATSPGGLQVARSIQLVIVGQDSRIYHMSLGTGTPSLTWDSPPTGTIIGTPACAVLYNNAYVVVRGTGDELWFTTLSLSTDTWGPWIDLRGTSPSTPVLLATPSLNSGRLDLVVRGEQDGIYHMGFPNSDPSLVWDSPGGSTPDSPSIASDGVNLHLAVRGENNGVFYNSMNFASRLWNSWTFLGGATLNAPQLAMDGSGGLHILVRGLDDGIYHKSLPQGGVWTSLWDSPGGRTLTSPSLDVYGSDLGILVQGTDNSIYYNSLILGRWQGWVPIGGSTSNGPRIVSTSEPIA